MEDIPLFEALPQSIFSWDYSIHDQGGIIGQLDLSVFRERATLSIQGQDFELHREGLPATVRVPKRVAGLQRASVAQASEVQPVWKADFVELRGKLPEELQGRLDDALRLALEL